MDFVRRNFPMSTSAPAEGSGEELFFDKDGHLEFAPNDREPKELLAWTKVLYNHHRHLPRYECHFRLLCTIWIFSEC